MPSLSPGQKAHFKENGYLFVRDVLDKDLMREALDVMWANMEENRDDPTTWLDKGYRTVPLANSDVGTRLLAESSIYEMAEEMVGKGKLNRGAGANTAYLNFPNSDKNWKRWGGHLDGYSSGEEKRGLVGRFTIAVTMYLDRVEPKGGGFTVWPGSHRIFADYFRTHPLDSTRGGVASFPLPEPVEFTGEAGDICFWHFWTYHNTSMNVSDRIRIAAITRLTRKNDEDHLLKFNVENGDPWQGWEGMA